MCLQSRQTNLFLHSGVWFSCQNTPERARHNLIHHSSCSPKTFHQCTLLNVSITTQIICQHITLISHLSSSESPFLSFFLDRKTWGHLCFTHKLKMGGNKSSKLVCSGLLLKGKPKFLCCSPNLGTFTQLVSIQSYGKEGPALFFRLNSIVSLLTAFTAELWMVWAWWQKEGRLDWFWRKKF